VWVVGYPFTRMLSQERIDKGKGASNKTWVFRIKEGAYQSEEEGCRVKDGA